MAMTMRRYLDDHGINDMFQSAYRLNHSTETALVKIFNDISLALGTGKKVVLYLLDLSAAFDTLKHSVLIDRLREIGLQDKALEWFQSYLSDRRMAVKIKEHVSELQVVKYGVPQGSVLGPILFNVYCLPLTTLIRKYGVSYHVYADDTQVYVECDKNDSSSAYATLYACINDIKEWLSSNFLLLNDKKTELIEYNSNGLNQNNHLVIGNTVIDTQPCVTNLGCVLDVGLVMSGHAARMCKSAYHHLRCIRKIKNCIPMEACKLLAIQLALENARDTRDTITIHTDSLTAINTLSNRKLHLNTITSAIRDAASRLTQRPTINWIPAHTGIPGNEKADHAAKRGLQLDRIDTTVNTSTFREQTNMKEQMERHYNDQAYTNASQKNE